MLGASSSAVESENLLIFGKLLVVNISNAQIFGFGGNLDVDSVDYTRLIACIELLIPFSILLNSWQLRLRSLHFVCFILRQLDLAPAPMANSWMCF